LEEEEEVVHEVAEHVAKNVKYTFLFLSIFL
jgi:hypothetical protein